MHVMKEQRFKDVLDAYVTGQISLKEADHFFTVESALVQERIRSGKDKQILNVAVSEFDAIFVRYSTEELLKITFPAL